MVNEMQASNLYSMEDFEQVLDNEFSVFKDGEDYDYVTDLKRAYENSLKTPVAERIFDRIPNHVFYDIKAPLEESPTQVVNPYTPTREYPYRTFFDMREEEEFFDKRHNKRNLRDDISTWRKY